MSRSDLLRLVDLANRGRRRGAPDRAVERELEASARPSIRLAVYGSLAPGESNHRMLSGIAGEWHQGEVTGRLLDSGWGAELGFPALTLDPDGAPVPVQILVSPDLRQEWSRLDEFEGDDYRRVLVLVELQDGAAEVANIYEAAAR